MSIQYCLAVYIHIFIGLLPKLKNKIEKIKLVDYENYLFVKSIGKKKQHKTSISFLAIYNKVYY